MATNEDGLDDAGELDALLRARVFGGSTVAFASRAALALLSISPAALAAQQ